MATFPSIEPSYGFTKTKRPNVRTIKFGDGYEHRLTFGLNQDPMVLSVPFNNITTTDATTIEDFLAARAIDNASFDFTAPGESSSFKFKCESYKKVLSVPNRASITAEFTQVFEP